MFPAPRVGSVLTGTALAMSCAQVHAIQLSWVVASSLRTASVPVMHIAARLITRLPVGVNRRCCRGVAGR